MKYITALVAGLFAGVALFALGFYYNPLVGQASLSPLAVTEERISSLSYSAVPSETILLTNDGESLSRPHPGKIAELWEPSIKDTELLVASLTDSRGRPAGIGIKVTSPSTDTRLFNSEMLVDSTWLMYLPSRGLIGIYQQENYFSYVRDIVVPAWSSSSDSWRGAWSRIMTVGPGAHGTARVIGLHGEFDGMQSEAVEELNARAYSVLEGPISMTGTITVELPSARTNEIAAN